MFRGLSRILRLEPTKILKGVDLQGNKYYEIPPQKYFLFQREVLKLKRTVETPGVDNTIFSAVEASKRVPLEWLAWLQWRRADPPEPGEVEGNLAKKQAIQVKVGLLNEKHKLESSSKPQPAEEKLQQAEVDEWKPH